MAINRIEQMKEYQQNANINPIDALKTVRGEQGLQATGASPMIQNQSANIEQQSPMIPQETSLNTLLKEDLPIHVADLKERGTSKEALREMNKLSENVSLQSIGMKAIGFNPDTATSKDGGLIGMAAGMPTQQAAIGGGIRNFEGQVPGQGHGMEDNVYMPIVERNRGQQVATLAVSPDEYVVDAHTMSALGNGSADAGAKVMDNVVDSVREKAYGTDQQPNEINGLAALRPMIERV